jgi:tetratricopeptide (TPR) repeat protein
MKKVTLIVALVSLGFAAGAQSLNVSSAYEAQNRGYLKKAKGYIDQAAEHEQTKAEAQTWYYRTMIYTKIGIDINQNKKSAKELKEIAPDWYRTAYKSALNWKQFDTKGEYTNNITPFFNYIANAYLDQAYPAFNDERNYTKVMGICDTAIQIFNMAGDKKSAQAAYYLAGISALNLKDNANVKKYFNTLVSQKTDRNQVYETLFNIYRTEKDTVRAMKTARSFGKNFPDKYEADMLMAQGYLMTGNMDKSKESIMAAMNKVGDDKVKKATLLCQVAAIYELTNAFKEAEEKYQESLQIDPDQFGANFSMGKMFYNRAVDKLDAANNVDPNDETGLYDKLNAESKELFGQSVQYFNKAIAYIDALPEAQKATNKANLFNCLNALKTVYLRLEMNTEFQAVNARLTALQSEK